MIVRIERRERGFTQIDNRTLRDDRLSFRARGVLSFLLSHRDDTTMSADEVWEQGPEGRDAIRTAFRELRDLGYMERRRVRDGTLWVTELVVKEVPDLSEACGQAVENSSPPTPENPSSAPTRENDAFSQVAPTTGFPTPENPSLGSRRRERRLEEGFKSRSLDRETDPEPIATMLQDVKRRLDESDQRARSEGHG